MTRRPRREAGQRSGRLRALERLREMADQGDFDEFLGNKAACRRWRLTGTGHHRSAGPVDLLISVTAERHRLTVLTDDRDFLAVAADTGQPARLVAGTN